MVEKYSLFKKEPTPEEKWRDQFRSYKEYFQLSNEDLQKPLLDVGAGDTAFVQYLRNVLGNKQAYGVEIRHDQLGEEKEGVIIANGFRLPFNDDTFEVVTTKHYLPMFVDHKEAMEAAVSELVRVTKPGGKIIGDISTPEKELAKRDGEPDEQKKKWLNNRYEGSKKFQLFLENLKNAGHLIEFSDGPQSSFNGRFLPSRIMTIHKAGGI